MRAYNNRQGESVHSARNQIRPRSASRLAHSRSAATVAASAKITESARA